MEEARGRSSGFDYLRLALALLVVASHSLGTASGTVPDFFLRGSGQFLHNIIVPMFFGLGGFLVAASLDRTKSLVTYLGLRSLRIFPALWVDILFSALVVGPLVTTLPLPEYFSAQKFWIYFLNLIGEIHYLLPGVFEHNPSPSVNGQLWTVPWDLGSYIALSVFVLFGLYRNRRNTALLSLLAQIGFPVIYAGLILVLHHHLVPQRVIVVPCFLTGVAFHVFRDRIRWNYASFLASLATIIILQLIEPRSILFLTLPIIYVTVFLGLYNPKRVWMISSGDYSYGTFLYHRQLQQVLWLFVPFARSWYGNLILSAPVALIFAYVSWHVIEKYALGRKSWLMAQDSRLVATLPITRIDRPEVGDRAEDARARDQLAAM